MRVLAAALVLCACSGGGGGGGSSPPPPPPAPGADGAVSGASPFPAGCGGGGGTAYVHAEVEPYLAVDPRDANHFIGVWQQDRWSNGSARGLLSGVSFDGGATWSTVQVPFSHCSGGNAQNGGDYARSTDPWVTFSPDGTAYQAALSTSGGAFTAASVNAVLVSRSADGGRTWSNPVALIRDTGATFFNDKEAISADPTDARFVYVVWDRLRDEANGPTWFTRTVDSGASWEPARQIHDPGPESQTIGNLVRVLPGGTLVNLFTQIDGPEDAPMSASLRVIRSADRGATWSAAIIVTAHQPLGVRDPATGQAIRDGSIVPQMAVAPDGTLYVVSQDARFSGARDAIAFFRSTDGGLTWSAPVRINADPTVAAFTPQVHVRADGAIGVTYYDLRSNTADPATLLADYWLARSSDGVSWTEARVAGPFDIGTAPLAGGALFIGDYMGLASAGATFLPFYVRTTGSLANRTDVFLARMPAASPAAAIAAEPMLAPRRDAGFERQVAANLRDAARARRTASRPDR